MLSLPQQWQGRFSLVFECRTIQALPLSVRPQVITAIARTVKATGQLWVVTRLRPNETAPTDGPPWAVSEAELAQLKRLNLQEKQRSVFTEAKSAEITQAAILYQHP